jgi:hypothetical protein
VNANKYIKHKFLILFSILEKDEEMDETIGQVDNKARLDVMKNCFACIKVKNIGPGGIKGNFILSKKLLLSVVHDIFKIRMVADPQWLLRY